MTDYTNANTISDLIRSIFVLLDKCAYQLLEWMYQILFNVTRADIFSNNTIHAFYSRVQLIIGVFMVFKLAVSIIQGIVNPDTFTDKKAGFSSIITRIIFALILLTALTPINIPNPKNSYEKQINNNGLLFGTLYSLQERILNNNTLGRLVLGPAASETFADQDNIAEMAEEFSFAVLKGFIKINLKDGQTDETKSANRICEDKVTKEVLYIYNGKDSSGKSNADPNKLLSLVNASCTYLPPSGSFSDKILGLFQRLAGTHRYVFAYIPIISTIVAVVFIYILLGEIITIAIRSIKLAVLRLIAPIPVISYIDPKSEKDGAFGAWVKALTSTYLELFIHLVVIYFVIFLIHDMIDNGISGLFIGSGIIGVLSTIFLWIGMFFFIRQAPKFIKDVLGVKGGGNNIGLAGVLGGAAMLAGGGGLRGFALGAMSGTESALQGANQGKQAPLGQIWQSNSDLMAKIRTGDKDARGGIIGGTMDQLNYQTRERRAGFLGIGAQNYADAQYIEDVRKAQAATTQQELDLAKMQLDSLGPNATDAERDAARRRYEEAYVKNASYQTALAKASKLADKMDKDRVNFGVGPRIGDTRRDKHLARYRWHGDEYDEAKHDYILREGTYRSPLTTSEDSKKSTLGGLDYNALPTNPVDQSDILGEVSGHKRDLKDFSGTADDTTFGGSGHGAPGGPRGGGPRP